MYDELVNLLRRCGKQKCKNCDYEHVLGCVTKLNEEAADAIEAQDRHILTLQHEMMAEAESHTALVKRLNEQIEKLQADVRPVVRGKWVKYAPHNSDMMTCSECEKYWLLDGDQYDYHFCPNCGADMREES